MSTLPDETATILADLRTLAITGEAWATLAQRFQDEVATLPDRMSPLLFLHYLAENIGTDTLAAEATGYDEDDMAALARDLAVAARTSYPLLWQRLCPDERPAPPLRLVETASGEHANAAAHMTAARLTLWLPDLVHHYLVARGRRRLRTRVGDAPALTSVLCCAPSGYLGAVLLHEIGHLLADTTAGGHVLPEYWEDWNPAQDPLHARLACMLARQACPEQPAAVVWSLNIPIVCRREEAGFAVIGMPEGFVALEEARATFLGWQIVRDEPDLFAVGDPLLWDWEPAVPADGEAYGLTPLADPYARLVDLLSSLLDWTPAAIRAVAEGCQGRRFVERLLEAIAAQAGTDAAERVLDVLSDADEPALTARQDRLVINGVPLLPPHDVLALDLATIITKPAPGTGVVDSESP